MAIVIVKRHYVRVDVGFISAFYRLQDISVVQEHLRGDTATIETSPTKRSLLDHSDRLSLVRCYVCHVEAGAGVNNEKNRISPYLLPRHARVMNSLVRAVT